MNVRIISNPVAGRGKAFQRARVLSALLSKEGIGCELFITEAKGDAERRAASLGNETGCIVVAGGDGTLNEVINGLHDPSSIPIVQLPSGTANILARELKLTTSPHLLKEIVLKGAVRRLDMGIANGRRFLSLISSGFDAMVIRSVTKSRMGLLGFHAYAIPIVRTILSYRAPALRVSVDHKEAMKCELVVISNIRNYAGFLSITDLADCTSGHFDASLFPKARIRDMAYYAFKAFRGPLSSLKDIIYARGNSFRIDSNEPVPVEIDGEDFGDTPVEVHIVPGCVPFLTS